MDSSKSFSVCLSKQVSNILVRIMPLIESDLCCSRFDRISGNSEHWTQRGINYTENSISGTQECPYLHIPDVNTDFLLLKISTVCEWRYRVIEISYSENCFFGSQTFLYDWKTVTSPILFFIFHQNKEISFSTSSGVLFQL